MNIYKILGNTAINMFSDLFTVELLSHYCIHVVAEIFVYTSVGERRKQVQLQLFTSWRHVSVTRHPHHTLNLIFCLPNNTADRDFFSPNFTSEVIMKNMYQPVTLDESVRRQVPVSQ